MLRIKHEISQSWPDLRTPNILSEPLFHAFKNLVLVLSHQKNNSHLRQKPCAIFRISLQRIVINIRDSEPWDISFGPSTPRKNGVILSIRIKLTETTRRTIQSYPEGSRQNTLGHLHHPPSQPLVGSPSFLGSTPPGPSHEVLPQAACHFLPLHRTRSPSHFSGLSTVK